MMNLVISFTGENYFSDMQKMLKKYMTKIILAVDKYDASGQGYYCQFFTTLER